MTHTLHYAVTISLAFAAFASLALAMPKHFVSVVGRELTNNGYQWLLRTLGVGLLAVSMGCCIRIDGVGVGLAAWCGVLTVAAFAVASLLSYRPRVVGVASVVSFAASAATFASQLM
jgi:hypothetical protein